MWSPYYLFSQLFKKHRIVAFLMPGTVLGTKDKREKKDTFYVGAFILEERKRQA